MKIDFSKKRKSIIDKMMEHSKIDISEAITSIFSGQKESIRFFETLPFSKELIEAFEMMSLRLDKHFNNQSEGIKIIGLKSFMSDFYKTLIISIDKKLKTSPDIGMEDVKNAFRKRENKTELKKALSVFNCKTKNNYFEFSKNGLIELYAQREYLNLKKSLQQIREKVKEQKPKTTSLKNGSKSIKIYREIINRILLSRLAKDKDYYYDANAFHIREIADEIGGDDSGLTETAEVYKRLENRFYKWTRTNPDRYRELIVDELNKIQTNQPF